jgi:hypothetical protein
VTAEPVEILDGDLVLVARHGLYVAWVRRTGPRHLAIEPCDRSIRDRRVRREEIRAVYRNVGRPAAAGGRLRPSPRQLRLDDALDA